LLVLVVLGKEVISDIFSCFCNVSSICKFSIWKLLSCYFIIILPEAWMIISLSFGNLTSCLFIFWTKLILLSSFCFLISWVSCSNVEKFSIWKLLSCYFIIILPEAWMIILLSFGNLTSCLFIFWTKLILLSSFCFLISWVSCSNVEKFFSHKKLVKFLHRFLYILIKPVLIKRDIIQTF